MSFLAVAAIFVLGLRVIALESGPSEARARLYATLAVMAGGVAVIGALYALTGP